eukprot:38608-Chlamydomonas_euryale.AAC.3
MAGTSSILPPPHLDTPPHTVTHPSRPPQRLDDEQHMLRCMDRSGKNPNHLEDAHVHRGHLAGGGSGSGGRATAHARARVQVARRELQAMSSEQVMERLRKVFEAYCNPKHYANTG